MTLVLAAILAHTMATEAETPIVHDPRLTLTLVAEHPEIVTPIGLAIDSEDRLFVVEPHTHHPPSDYPGPKSDRVKVFADGNGDGIPDQVSMFADGLDAAMNLAFSPEGILYVVCAREVFALCDDDSDGVCERKERVVELVTTERYAHNCLLGITFDSEGWMYIARGNTGSREYTLRGTDGSEVSGYGDGGILRPPFSVSGVSARATAQLPDWQWSYVVWLLVVVCGCFGLIGNHFSTVSAQSDIVAAGVLAGVIPEGRATRRRRRRLAQAIEADDDGDSAASYSRYSSSLQRDESVDQQQDAARRAAASIRRKIDDELLRNIVRNADYSAEVRALAVTGIRRPHEPKNMELLRTMTRQQKPLLQLAAVRKLAEVPDASVSDIAALARDRDKSGVVRAEAIAALGRSANTPTANLLGLLDDSEQTIAVEAARSLRHLRLDDSADTIIRAKWESIRADPKKRSLAEQLAFAIKQESPHPRPKTLQQWQHALAKGGDVEAGRRVFHSLHATCSKCHTIGQSGGTLGPDLSHVAQSIDRSQIVHSILQPSDKFPPQYQAWQVITHDGKIHTGLQLDHKAGGNINLFTTDGYNVRFKADEIEAYRASPNSVMPNGLEKNLGVAELRDLVAFLDSLR